MVLQILCRQILFPEQIGLILIVGELSGNQWLQHRQYEIFQKHAALYGDFPGQSVIRVR